MKTNRFLSLAAIFGLAITFTFFACSSDSPSESPPAGEPSSDSSGNAVKLCGNVEYDDSIYRCESGELIGKCRGADFYPAYQVCNDGVIEDKGTDVSSSSNPDISSSSNITCKENFLGMGYDIIKSSYINRSDVKVSNSILDQSKLCQDNNIVTSAFAGVQDFWFVTGGSIKEFYQEKNKKLNVNLGNGITEALFSKKLGAEFSSAINESSVERVYYSQVRSFLRTQDDYIKGATAQNLSNYLTSAFASDLKTRDAEQILDQYGTHVFIRYFKGGSLEANYTYTGKTLKSNSTVNAAVQASFGPISGGASTSTQKADIDSTANTSFNYYTYGGKPLGATSLAQLKNEYKSWVESIANQADICDIAEFNQSLMPIWELAKSAGEMLKATQLETAFRNRAISQGVAFPKAKIYKTDIKPYSASGTYSLSYSGGTIAEIEIYALGAGGGGQGGDYTYSGLFTDIGTGGAGGGGAATYVKLGKFGLNKNDPISLDITIGNGGTGGNYIYENISGQHSGYNGSKGGDTKVVYKSATVTAYGGSGGGGNSPLTTGGAGGIGSTSTLPTSSIFYMKGYSVTGSSGSNGEWQSEIKSTGGDAAKITGEGTLESFGGGKGAVLPLGGASPTNPENGGGGRGSYSNNKGTDGGKGLVSIVVKYFTEDENSTYIQPSSSSTYVPPSSSSSRQTLSSSSIYIPPSSSSSRQTLSSSSIYIPPSSSSNGQTSSYKTVVIGSQTWMAENLNNNVSGSVCYNNLASNCGIYGRLYNWATAMALPSSCNNSSNSSTCSISAKHKGICPSGWHIPSDADWDALMTTVGGSSTAGKKLKAASGWNSSGNGTNEYGFSALPGGYGNSDGSFSSVDKFGYWWSSSEYSDGTAYIRDMGYDYENIFRSGTSKDRMYSVRCVKD